LPGAALTGEKTKPLNGKGRIPKIKTIEERSMKPRKAVLFLIVPSLFLLFACAHVSSSGSQTAVLHVPECLE
jgi:hypothetical protein